MQGKFKSQGKSLSETSMQNAGPRARIPVSGVQTKEQDIFTSKFTPNFSASILEPSGWYLFFLYFFNFTTTFTLLVFHLLIHSTNIFKYLLTFQALY